eukprot:CAMPEP_0119327700 /NCGR_PEP_ID=MMETSP1333-20130426/71465_1 /TAXON_ID=418940 /ORGANISM="Scyphosphaera apsteinii, Strain RCC1455" /LENGTH=73 /DNA_ID=CAMNT_0007336369 /DNA_START=322 /DNA_END=543 /DNA_ORIENTATION=-
MKSKKVLLERYLASLATKDTDCGTYFKKIIEEAKCASSGLSGAPRPEHPGQDHFDHTLCTQCTRRQTATDQPD